MNVELQALKSFPVLDVQFLCDEGCGSVRDKNYPKKKSKESPFEMCSFLAFVLLLSARIISERSLKFNSGIFVCICRDHFYLTWGKVCRGTILPATIPLRRSTLWSAMVAIYRIAELSSLRSTESARATISFSQGGCEPSVFQMLPALALRWQGLSFLVG